MKKLLDYDGKLMQILNAAADLMILNVLTVVFSIPFFTIGASVTAMHYTLYKIHRKEEETVFKDFLKAFRSNFAQSTILWLLFLLFAGVLAADYYLVTRVLNLTQINMILVLLIFIGCILLLGALTWVFICDGINNDDRVAEIIQEHIGDRYCRTITSTHSFELQENLYRFNPSVSHLEWDKMMEMAAQFVAMKPKKPQIFYIWCHSDEMDFVNFYWDRLEALCKLISSRENTFYGTNLVVLL